MPITDMHFTGGIFFACEVGEISGADARLWAAALRECAAMHPNPIVTLIDAREATKITNEARRVFAIAAETPNVRVAVVVSSRMLVTQQSRMTALMATVRNTHNTHFFDTMEEAYAFAQQQVSQGPAYS